jgi:hypothetical protein
LRRMTTSSNEPDDPATLPSNLAILMLVGCQVPA